MRKPNSNTNPEEDKIFVAGHIYVNNENYFVIDIIDERVRPESHLFFALEDVRNIERKISHVANVFGEPCPVLKTEGCRASKCTLYDINHRTCTATGEVKGVPPFSLTRSLLSRVTTNAEDITHPSVHKVQAGPQRVCQKCMKTVHRYFIIEPQTQEKYELLKKQLRYQDEFVTCSSCFKELQL